jgi:MerR family transcriptional regulator/heat shock protein HspR
VHTYEEPVYLISVVAKVLSIHPQTLRQYEREGLISPSRTDGKMRLYSQRDIDRIKMVLRLTRDLGVNLAGVDVVLQLKEKLEEYEMVIDELKEEISKISQKGTIAPERSLVKSKSTYEIILFGE